MSPFQWGEIPGRTEKVAAVSNECSELGGGCLDACLSGKTTIFRLVPVVVSAS